MARVPETLLEMIPDGSQVQDDRKEFLLSSIEHVMASNWSFSRRHWSQEDSPFHADFGLAFYWVDGKIIGYNIYKRVHLAGQLIIYRAGTAVSTAYQGIGYYREMSQAIMALERKSTGENQRLYVSWRTRNPTIFRANARICTSVVPSVDGTPNDKELESLGVRLGQELYPNSIVELPHMVMRGVYEHLVETPRSYPNSPSSLVSWFAKTLPDPADAILALGLVADIP